MVSTFKSLMLVLLFGFAGPALSTPVKLSGLQFSPDPGWKTVASSTDSVQLERREGQQLQTLRFEQLALDGALEEEAFLQQGEDRLKRELGDDKVLSQHFQYTRIKGTTCVLHDHILQRGDKGFQLLKGLWCQALGNPAQALRLEATLTIPGRDEPAEAQFRETADRLFASAEFLPQVVAE